jgi:HK97 family phage portal protein
MRLGKFEISLGGPRKGYNQLAQMIMREKTFGSTRADLKKGTPSQLKEYRSWVYSCVSLISDRVSTIPFKFYDVNTGEELTTRNRGFASYTKPFYKPNDMMTFRFIKQFCQIQLDLCGMAAVYLARNKLGQVWELWPLNMNDFEKVEISQPSGPMNPKVIYKFQIDGQEFKFGQEELCLLHYPDPTDPFLPMSPIRAQAYAIDIDNYVEVYERSFFKNSARVDMVLTTEEALDQVKADEIKARWKARYGGSFHDIAVLDSKLKPVPVNYTNKDFEFLALAGWSKEKVLSAFRVPEAKLGAGDSINRSGGVQVDINFNRESIHPRLTLWDEELSKEVLSSFNQGNVVIRHDDPIPRDRQIELQEVKAFGGGMPVMTPNEIRERWFNLPKVANDPEGRADILWVPSKWRPIDEEDSETQGGTDGDMDANDPTRHDGDQPHENPDGSDDRDDLPTEGRMYAFETLEADFRDGWVDHIRKALNSEESTRDTAPVLFRKAVDELIDLTTRLCMTSFANDLAPEYKNTEWPEVIATIATREFEQIIANTKCDEDWDSWCSKYFDINPRISKIINSLIRGTINYSKCLHASRAGIQMHWKVNGNECGHRGRVKQTIEDDALVFKIGESTINFPGETLNFACDCTIVPVVNSD